MSLGLSTPCLVSPSRTGWFTGLPAQKAATCECPIIEAATRLLSFVRQLKPQLGQQPYISHMHMAVSNLAMQTSQQRAVQLSKALSPSTVRCEYTTLPDQHHCGYMATAQAASHNSEQHPQRRPGHAWHPRQEPCAAQQPCSPAGAWATSTTRPNHTTTPSGTHAVKPHAKAEVYSSGVASLQAACVPASAPLEGTGWRGPATAAAYPLECLVGTSWWQWVCRSPAPALA